MKHIVTEGHRGFCALYPENTLLSFEKAIELGVDAVEFDGYDAYVDIGLNMNIVRSEVFPIYPLKGLPMHLYCADTEEDVRLCMEKGASLITANDPRPLMKVLGRL